MATLPNDIANTVTRALEEDIGSGDISAMLIPADRMAEARLITRETAILCGLPWAREVIRQIDPAMNVEWYFGDGDSLIANDIVATFSGPARSLLTAERCVLNFLQTLSGTATFAARLRSLVAHTSVTLLDTRKTLPGLRSAQKYAVRTGGCTNHRMGLYDAFLIKENHISACGSIAAAVEAARDFDATKTVEVEVESLEQLEQSIAAGAGIVMLDNFSTEQMIKAVKINAGRVKLEASGGVDESTLVQIAETGVDFISVGALTKNCEAIDLSLRFD
ncbi:MAG: carboxylating nicotinate-nucleotide diphosphorylase [Gammaproteobacteria bacterium]|nr:carboxylating nicotinate-nucleotide diphosphorylase [Pseudomonadales bacterium]MCP5345588.1 carboxylating nicotinate-nucleotide diphosphorylase [Pseudomonadales bacterium]